MADATFATSDLTTFARLDGLGLRVTGQFLEPDRAVLACRIVAGDATCGRRGDKYVTVIIDLTPVRDCTGPARLLDMVEGRSKQVFKTWLSQRDQTWRNGVEVVAMDGFNGFKTAAVEELKDDVTVVMDQFHVVRLAGQSLELCRRRIQQQTLGHRGRTGDALYSARRTLSTGADLLTDKQRQRISALFAQDGHLEVEATWGVYQAMVAADRDPDRRQNRDAEADRHPASRQLY